MGLIVGGIAQRGIDHFLPQKEGLPLPGYGSRWRVCTHADPIRHTFICNHKLLEKQGQRKRHYIGAMLRCFYLPLACSASVLCWEYSAYAAATASVACSHQQRQCGLLTASQHAKHSRLSLLATMTRPRLRQSQRRQRRNARGCNRRDGYFPVALGSVRPPC